MIALSGQVAERIDFGTVAQAIAKTVVEFEATMTEMGTNFGVDG